MNMHNPNRHSVAQTLSLILLLGALAPGLRAATFTVNSATLTGTGLTAGTNAITLASKDPASADIAIYDAASATQTDFSSYAALISNPSS